jgi:hypothetical protein
MKFKSIKEMKEKLYKRTLLDEMKYYCFYIWWNWLEERPRKLYWFLQRGWRGYADCDTWDFDNYLSTIIPQALRQLKKYQTGLPTWRKGKSEKQAKKEWIEIQNKIIEAFELGNKYINANIPPNIWKEKYETQYKEGMNLFRDWFFALWD